MILEYWNILLMEYIRYSFFSDHSFTTLVIQSKNIWFFITSHVVAIVNYYYGINTHDLILTREVLSLSKWLKYFPIDIYVLYF